MCSLCTCSDKKEINKWKINTNVFKSQFLWIKFLAVQWTHKIYFAVCIYSSSAIVQQSYSNRIICSALKTVCAVFFDLLSFFCMYRESFFFFFFFFFFSIGPKEITAQETDTDLTEKWESDDNREVNAATAMSEV